MTASSASLLNKGVNSIERLLHTANQPGHLKIGQLSVKGC
jgi:hypothetical protein